MRGQPTSRMSCSRNSSRSASRALLELLEAAPAEGPVGGPVGVVERPPGRPDGPLHVVDRGVGHLAEHFLGGRIDVPERLALAASTSSPSISILGSGCTLGASVVTP